MGLPSAPRALGRRRPRRGTESKPQGSRRLGLPEESQKSELFGLEWPFLEEQKYHSLEKEAPRCVAALSKP